jgi:class 3 adenylate cyclase/pSer/pThr/pTyr-binding forkhead associated (FHA) protein
VRLGLKLVAVNGSQAVAVPAGRTLVVGRSPACDVPIRDLTVSRHHGEIEAAAGGLRIRDLGSTNGTFINSARISEGIAAPGSRVAFGKVSFQVMEERISGDELGVPSESESEQLAIVAQVRGQGSTDLATLLAADPAAGGGSRLRVRGATPEERRPAALALLLEVAKELSQQGETARLLDKAARLTLQALNVDRVEILVRGEGDEMVPRVSKIRPGGAAGDGRVPRLAARKALLERVAVLIAETVPAASTGSLALRRDAEAGAVGEAAAGQAEAPDTPRPAPLATTDAVQVSADRAKAESGALARSGEQVRGAGAAPAPPDGPARGSAICAPLLGMQATVLGLLYVVAGEDGALGVEELEFLAGFAGVVAVSLENLWLMERARGEAVAEAGYQRHFGPVVAEQVAGRDGSAEVGAVRRRIAFLCCEIRGLTAVVEEREPADVAHQLSELLGEMVEVTFEHGGTLERLSGGGLTALWGAPLGRQDDADEAVQAAVAMQRGLERLNGEWGRHQQPQLGMAIGIDLGLAFAGNIGSDRRLDYTAIGRPVERSAQLCAAAAGGEVLVSSALVEALSNPPPVDAVPAREAASTPAAAAPPAAAGTDLAYRIDWRTPPTLKQSGELPQA